MTTSRSERSAASDPRLAFPKGQTRRARKAAAHVAEVAQIRETRVEVFRRDRSCTVCFGTRRRECVKAEHEMNEIVPRSKTRGRPPAERFNVRNCHRVCSACHQDITEKRIRVSGDAHLPRGVEGGLTVAPYVKYA